MQSINLITNKIFMDIYGNESNQINIYDYL